jgi:adhesin transport system outer membrane protein
MIFSFYAAAGSVFVALCLAQLPAYGQSVPGSSPSSSASVATVVPGASNGLSLEEALATAAMRHPMVASKRQESVASGQSLNTARWQQFPTLSVSTSSQQGSGAGTTLRLEQPLWTGGKITADIEASEAKLVGAELAVFEVLQTALVDVAKNFIDTVRFGERVAASEENVAEHERLLGLIERRAENQVSPMNEVVSARARLQQARSELLQLRNSLENARSALSIALGESGSKLRTPDTTVPRWLSTQDEVIARALAYAPKLRRMAAEKRQLEAEMRARKSTISPQISIRRDEYFNKANALNGGRDSLTYVALNFQTGAGLSYQSAVAEAMSKIKAAEFSQESLERDIRDAMRADWNEWQSSFEGGAIFEQLVSSSQDVYDSFLRQFSAGRKSWLDVLNARKEATQARHSLSDTRWAGYLAGLRIEIASGSLPMLQQNGDRAQPRGLAASASTSPGKQ